MIGSDYHVIVSGDFICRECGRIVSSLNLIPKLIQRLSSSYCGLRVVVDDDDVAQIVADDDVADRKIRV